MSEPTTDECNDIERLFYHYQAVVNKHFFLTADNQNHVQSFYTLNILT